MIKCPKCGADNMLNAIFCRSCGEKLNLAELKIENQLEDAEDKSKNMSKLVNQIVGGILAFVIVLILALVFIPTTGNLPAEKPSAEAKKALKEMSKGKESKVVTLTEQDMTNLLNKAFQLPKKSEGNIVPQSISVKCLEEGAVKIIMKSKVFGFLPMNANVQLKPVVKKRGEVEFENVTGIRIGWLPFLPAVATDPFVAPFKGMAHNDNSLKRARSNTKGITVKAGALDVDIEKHVSKKASGKGKPAKAAPAPVVLPF